MSDVFDKEKRSWLMKQVHSKDTNPEKLVRSLIHKMGYRFRLHRKELPGKPDIIFPSMNKIIFVNGCFWHGHKCKRGNRIPKNNLEYWSKKIKKNVIRDKLNNKKLINNGWKCLTVWECELKNIDDIARKIEEYLEE